MLDLSLLAAVRGSLVLPLWRLAPSLLPPLRCYSLIISVARHEYIRSVLASFIRYWVAHGRRLARLGARISCKGIYARASGIYLLY